MVTLPVRREPAPLVLRPSPARSRGGAGSEASRSAEPALAPPGLDERISASVDAALTAALAKVSTPEDDALAKQQAAFDRLVQQRAEAQRESNAIREMALEQMKHEDEFMKKFIEMI